MHAHILENSRTSKTFSWLESASISGLFARKIHGGIIMCFVAKLNKYI